jgi:hypothetical protein
MRFSILRPAMRTSSGRNGTQRGILRRRATDVSASRHFCRSKLRRYCRIISGMLIRNAAEKFWIAISV